MTYRLLYITTPDVETAGSIAHALLNARLIACANILPGMTALYRWEGAIQQEEEVVLLCKTTAGHAAEATALVVANHPYDCPCVVSLEIKDGHEPFLNWLSSETV